MLLAPSPRYVRTRPASDVFRSRTVCRSARIWQGWNRSVRALTTGTRLTDAMAAIRS